MWAQSVWLQSWHAHTVVTMRCFRIWERETLQESQLAILTVILLVFTLTPPPHTHRNQIQLEWGGWDSHFFSKGILGLGGGLRSKLTAGQIWGFTCGSPETTKKSLAWRHAYAFLHQESWGLLLSQPSPAAELQDSEGPCLKNKVGASWGMAAMDVLRPPHTHA